jgi:hypothetical protein
MPGWISMAGARSAHHLDGHLEPDLLDQIGETQAAPHLARDDKTVRLFGRSLEPRDAEVYWPKSQLGTWASECRIHATITVVGLKVGGVP